LQVSETFAKAFTEAGTLEAMHIQSGSPHAGSVCLEFGTLGGSDSCCEHKLKETTGWEGELAPAASRITIGGSKLTFPTCYHLHATIAVHFDRSEDMRSTKLSNPDRKGGMK